jgi:hypothetical protein
MRGLLGLSASALGGLAAIIASEDRDPSIVPFFVGMAFLGAVAGWATGTPYVGPRRTIGRAVGLIWLGSGIWVAVLLGLYQLTGGDRPTPPPEATYAGLTATVYHLAGLYGGLALVLVGTFGPDRWFRPSITDGPLPGR